MGLNARFILKNTEPPIKGYIFDTGLIENYAPRRDRSHQAIIYAREHANQLIKHHSELFVTTKYIIASIWGKDLPKTKIAEFFGFDMDLDNWPDNPGVCSWVFHDGVYQPNQEKICCGNMIRLLAMEEEARKGTKNLEDFLDLRTFLADLQPRIEI